MTSKELIEVYLRDPRVVQLRDNLQSKEYHYFHLPGVKGSMLSVIIKACNHKRQGINLLLLNNYQEAIKYYSDLVQLSGKGNNYFFPALDGKNNQDIDQGHELKRIELLEELSEAKANQSAITIVSYTEAISQNVPSLHQLKKKTIGLQKGQSFDLDEQIGNLFELGFERADFVYKPGEFAIRGGIIDVYSFSKENPIRIELSGNIVESIREFDTNSQISINELNQVSLVPNLTNDNEPLSLIEFIKKPLIIWTRNISDTKMKLVKYTGRDIDLHSFTIIELGNDQTNPNPCSIPFNGKSQPSFNKNFNLLRQDLIKKTQDGWQNIILTANTKQIERLNAVFEDLSPNQKIENQITDPIPATLFSPLLLSLHEGFTDPENKIACYTDHQLFNRNHRFSIKKRYAKSQALTIKEFNNLRKGDYVVHIDHGIGKFAGLEIINVNGKPQEAIRLTYKEGDIVYVSIHSLHRISKYSGKEGHEPKLDKIGSGTWKKLKERTKKKVKDIAKELIKLYAERKAKTGFGFSPDTYLQNELEASFIFEDTPDQLKATHSTKQDMESSVPMDRLICGDVGFGKTEIAIRAAFKAVADNKQVAILVPTTILAMQHYQTFRSRLREFPCNVDYINRFKSNKQQKKSIADLKSGKTDIIIGTHRLISKDITFQDLGLLIIDEEQKFGVTTKEKIKSIRVNVDTLTLTATPIPRTLQFSIMGARDLSIINTPPPNRRPINTQLIPFDHHLIAESINTEVTRGGQVFFVHNRVQNIEEIAQLIRKLCPKVRVMAAHGQMEGKILEKVMLDFIDGEYDVLVATTIIESGLDIPNANTIIINNAHHYGLSDLHQMRGRVGRSNEKAYCMLITPALSSLTPEANKRLQTIEEFSELGSGFNIAMRDLDIRGAGNLLGAEQSGFINELGFETYHKVLDEAIEELKHGEFKSIFPDGKESKSTVSNVYVKECQLETDMEILIPNNYVNSIQERLRLYKELNEIEEQQALNEYETMLADRFGPLPKQVNALLKSLKLKWMAAELGFEKLVLKQGKMIGYFLNNPSSGYFESPMFRNIIQFVNSQMGGCQLKEGKNKLSLTFSGINSITIANETFRELSSFLEKNKPANSKALDPTTK